MKCKKLFAMFMTVGIVASALTGCTVSDPPTTSPSDTPSVSTAPTTRSSSSGGSSSRRSGSSSGGSSSSGKVTGSGAGGYDMPNENDQSCCDYVKRVDPERYDSLFD